MSARGEGAAGEVAVVAGGPQKPKVRRWKNDFRLNGRGKEGSRMLALHLFPQAAHLLRCPPPPPLFCARVWGGLDWVRTAMNR